MIVTWPRVGEAVVRVISTRFILYKAGADDRHCRSDISSCRWVVVSPVYGCYCRPAYISIVVEVSYTMCVCDFHYSADYSTTTEANSHRTRLLYCVLNSIYIYVSFIHGIMNSTTKHTHIGVVTSYIKQCGLHASQTKANVANRRCTYALDVLSGAQRVLSNATYYIRWRRRIQCQHCIYIQGLAKKCVATPSIGSDNGKFPFGPSIHTESSVFNELKMCGRVMNNPGYEI